MQLNLDQHEWLREAPLQRLFAAFGHVGAEARCVGGCVRDALAGRVVRDIDMAVNIEPEQAEAALRQASIRSERTGFEHGTITAVIAGKGYEITSLRRDVATDGRRAVVAYTDDWKEDASRRDFTMNALYCDAQGQVTDYFDGLGDLRQGRVRFIGNAEARIAEDYLRILRYFRFHAWFGLGPMDETGVLACALAAPSLAKLSVERVWQEFKKLIMAPDPIPTMRTLHDRRIVDAVLPEMLSPERLAKVVHVQHEVRDRSPMPRVAALLPPDRDVAGVIAKRLKMSGAEAASLRELAEVPQFNWDEVPLVRTLLFNHERSLCLQWLMLYGADNALDVKRAYAKLVGMEKPVLPVTGDDLQKMGVAEGPKLGYVLRQLTGWWLEQDPLPEREACLAKARKILAG